MNAVASAPAACRVRVWEVMSRGCGPRVGCPPPESVDAAYPPVHKHFFLTQNRLPAKHPKRGRPLQSIDTDVFDRVWRSRSYIQVWHPALLVSKASANLRLSISVPRNG